MPIVPNCQPRSKPPPYKRKPKETTSKTGPPVKTSAQPLTTSNPKRQNLTLNDWLTVFAYVNTHPSLSQAQVVEFFRTRVQGKLEFTHASLSRKLKARNELEERVHSNPTALSSKRPRVVTHPDVEEALLLWIGNMETKSHVINGPMLRVKRQKLEKQMNVPEAEWLVGDGWIAPFCRAYNIKEHRRHGKAGSVDQEMVKQEQLRVAKLLSTFPRKDRFNFDETSLFTMAPPDRGLAMKQMSGKKKEKFRLTLSFAVNADRSEKLPLFFIGYARKPCCFNSKTPQSAGFDYRSNKKAWMTGELFEEWVKTLDVRMGIEHRFICLLVDNFSGHKISYSPHNIQIVFFEPNLTSFVQPLDAGIIRCFKAHYHRQFCSRALELDEAGNDNIWKINLREAMVMASNAWAAVTPTTIQHCWNHTSIQGDSETAPLSHPAHADPGAWAIVCEFALNDATLPQVHASLQQHLGTRYITSDWNPALDAIMAAEGNVVQATEAIDKLSAATCMHTGLVLKLSAHAKPPQLESLEKDLSESVANLKAHNRIFGELLTLDELLDPIEEKENFDTDTLAFEDDMAIIAEVHYWEALRKGDIIEVDSDDDDDDDDTPVVTTAELVGLCQQLEDGYISRAGADASLDFLHHVHAFRAKLRYEETKNAKQITLHRYMKSN